MEAKADIGKPVSANIVEDKLHALIGNCSPDPAWGTPDVEGANRVLQLVNDHRRSIGEQAVSQEPALSSAAAWKAMHMAGFQYMQHDDPSPPVARSWIDRLQACGYQRGWAGENIAWGYATADEVMRGWLGSSEHRANIENPRYNRLGVGCARRPDGTAYWTQDFGVGP